MRIKHILGSILAASSLTGGTFLAAAPAHAADACGTMNSDYVGHVYTATAFSDIMTIIFEEDGNLEIRVHESTGSTAYTGTYYASPDWLSVSADVHRGTDEDVTVYRGCDGESSTPGILIFRDIQAPFVLER